MIEFGLHGRRAASGLGQQPSLVRIESRALTETLVELATAVTTGELLSSSFLVCLSRAVSTI